MNLIFGQTLRGRYQILRPLGSGGFSETYLAEDKDLPGNPLCVVKQLKPKDPDPSVLQTARRLFETEAQVLYRLGKHEQIPQLFAHFEENREFYLVQEFIEGEDLGQELALCQPLNESEVVQLLQDVLKILAFVHQQNVIHRDIKPSNLMRRRPDGQFILIDFGAVKEIRTLMVNSHGQTTCTVPIGSSGYMPNEQQGGKPRFSSDIYGLGMTAIQALTGVSPEKLPEDPQTGEICWREYTQVSNRLAAILDKMVRSHFRDRYQSTNEVLDDLQKLQQSTGIFTQHLVGSGLRRQRWVKISHFLVILLAAGTTFGFAKLFQFHPIENQSLLLESLPTETPSITPTPVVSPDPTPQPPEASELFTQGNTLVELRRYEDAIAVLDRAIQIQPDYSEAWAKRGEALGQLQKNEEALKAYEEALKFHPNYATAWYQRGVILEKLNRNEEALLSLDKAVEIQPDFAPAWYSRGVVLDKQQRYEEAISALNKVVQIQPDYGQAFYHRGVVLNKLERYEEALTALDRALQLQPANLEVWVERGYALGQLQKYEDAIAAFDKALQIDPNAAQAWGKRGYVLGQLKRYEEAIASLDKAVQIKSDDAQAWYNRGILLEKLRRYEDAIAALDKATQTKADYSEAWYRRGVVFEKMRKYEDAIAAYDKTIEIWPAHQEAIQNRKNLLLKLKR